MFRRHKMLTFSVAAIALAVMLAVFVPARSPPTGPPPQPARDEVFIDNVGLVSADFVSSKTIALLANESLAQFLVYITASPPQGDLEDYTVETVSAWHVGEDRADNGIVLFIFPDVRKARLEVGYGLEGTLSDAVVSDLLDDSLVGPFGRGEYESGIDAVVSRVLEILIEAGTVRHWADSPSSWAAVTRSAFKRIPRMARLSWNRFVDADLSGRLGLDMFALGALYVVAAGLYCAFKALSGVVLLPQRWRSSPARMQRLAFRKLTAARDARKVDSPPPVTDILGDLHVFDIGAGSVGFVMCFVLSVAILLQVDVFSPRKGHFGGAGVTVVWPIPPARAGINSRRDRPPDFQRAGATGNL